MRLVTNLLLVLISCLIGAALIEIELRLGHTAACSRRADIAKYTKPDKHLLP